MKINSHCWKVIRIAIISIFFFAGCKATIPPVAFYTLSAMQNTGGSSHSDLAIVVGPVSIPQILNRPQIVTQTGANKIVISEYHLWAGNLQEDVERVVAENLGVLLATDRVTIYSKEDVFDPTYRIVLNVNRFTGNLDQDVQLIVAWTVKEAKGNNVLIFNKSTIRERITSADFQGLVAAQSRALSVLSQEIAESIKRLSEN